MVLTITLTAITVVTSIFVAAVFVVALGTIAVALVERHRRQHESVERRIDAEYRCAIHRMNEAAGQSWRNVLD